MPKQKNNSDPVEEEKVAETDAEAMAHHAPEASLDEIAGNADEEAEKAAAVEKGTDTDQALPSEVAAIHEESELTGSRELPQEPKSKLERRKVKKTERREARVAEAKKHAAAQPKLRRSTKYRNAKKKIESGKLYKVAEAIQLVKETAFSKFDSAVEVHLRLAAAKKSKGGTESQKGVFHLPHGTGKEKKIAVLDEKMIEQIEKTKKLAFDVYLAAPELMPRLAKIAKILGPKGKMPDPKSGTVTADPKKTIGEIQGGKVEYRIDSTNNVHQMIGRVSWDAAHLAENARIVLNTWPKSRLAGAYLCATIGPSVPLDPASL